MKKIKLTVEYDGSDFHGWQRQKEDVRTVQGCLEEALSRVANSDIQIVAAGRTDAGVHARAQVVHFNSAAPRTMRSWCLGANTFLPPDIRVLDAQEVAADFDARRSARRRTYRYFICNHAYRPSVHRQAMTWFYQPLDIELMQAGANQLIGEHDFSSFRAQGCQSHSPMREVYEIQFSQDKEMITMEISANAFLHHMVRNIVGSLKLVGMKNKQPDWIQTVLFAKDRKLAGPTAPPEGLFLWSVDYD